MSQPTPCAVREHEFLLSCAAGPNDPAARAQFARLSGAGLDWNCVLETAQLHGMLPLLRSAVEEFGAFAVPPAIRADLMRACIANGARNLALTGELLRILDLFEAEGIEAVPFKGPALAEQIFGSIGMRQFCDLDLLVRPNAVIRARNALVARGYVPEFVLSPEREAEYIRAEHAFQLRREEGGVVVELHWRLGSKDQAFPLEAEDVWARLRPATLQQRPILALSPEDLLLYLSMHGAKHKWERLEWVCSLARLIGQTRIDWAAALSRARQTGALRGLHLGLLLAQEICAAPLPPPLAEQAIRDRGAAELAAQAKTALFEGRPDHRVREFQRHAFYMRSRERVADRARIVWFSAARIPHPLARDWDLFRLPARLSFLYYLLRPLRLFRDYGLRLLQD